MAAAATFRQKAIPLDAIVQDWRYWGDMGWGPQWDPKVYPDPKGMVANLSAANLKLMVSVWSRFDAKTKFYQQMDRKGWLLNGTGSVGNGYYDAWHPDARELFYSFSKAAHFDNGVEALWLDATEPEHFPHLNQTTYLGSANEYFNSYSLMTTMAIADGLR